MDTRPDTRFVEHKLGRRQIQRPTEGNDRFKIPDLVKHKLGRRLQRPTEGNYRFKIPDLVKTLHWTRGRNEASPTPLRLQGCSTTQGNLPRLLLGRTRLQHQASLKSVSVRLQVARSAAFFNIKLWRCCDPDSLSPKVGHHLHLASSAVPRYRP